MNKEMTFEANECVDEVTAICESCEDVGGRGVGKKIVIALGVASGVALVVRLIRKHKAKIEEKRDKHEVNRLRGKGYTIAEPLDDLEVAEESESVQVETEEN